MDVGAGDGAAAVRTARSVPTTFAIAIDASTDALIRGSRVARRRRLPNALFVVGGVETLPAALDRVADLVTVNFPWGSLLRGIACGDDAVIGPLARLAKPGTSIEMLLSAEPRDRVAGVPSLDAAFLAANSPRYVRAGLRISACRPATEADLRASGSSWAKRLLAGRPRPVIALTLRRH